MTVEEVDTWWASAAAARHAGDWELSRRYFTSIAMALCNAPDITARAEVMVAEALHHAGDDATARLWLEKALPALRGGEELVVARALFDEIGVHSIDDHRALPRSRSSTASSVPARRARGRAGEPAGRPAPRRPGRGERPGALLPRRDGLPGQAVRRRPAAPRDGGRIGAGRGADLGGGRCSAGAGTSTPRDGQGRRGDGPVQDGDTSSSRPRRPGTPTRRRRSRAILSPRPCCGPGAGRALPPSTRDLLRRATRPAANRSTTATARADPAQTAAGRDLDRERHPYVPTPDRRRPGDEQRGRTYTAVTIPPGARGDRRDQRATTPSAGSGWSRPAEHERHRQLGEEGPRSAAPVRRRAGHRDRRSPRRCRWRRCPGLRERRRHGARTAPRPPVSRGARHREGPGALLPRGDGLPAAPLR